MKVFTATLIEGAITAGELTLDDLVAPFFDGLDGKLLTHINVGHLLNHTHGLDDSLCTLAPRDEKGFINRSALIANCANARLGQPGEIYSYSNVGSWIAGCVLERLYGIPYEAILRDRLLGPLGIGLSRIVDDPCLVERGVCPATGGVVIFTVGDILKFLNSVIDRPRCWPSGKEGPDLTPMPGWNPFERGIFRGWKYHGESWYGHNAITKEGFTSLVRINPKQRISLVIASRYHQSSMVAAKIFGKALPEYKNLRVPKALPSAAFDDATLHRYEGTYCNAAEAISIRNEGSRGLVLRTREFAYELTLAESDVLLFSKRTHQSLAGFVQLLQSDDCGYRYLWDGRRIYANKRVGVSRNEIA